MLQVHLLVRHICVLKVVRRQSLPKSCCPSPVNTALKPGWQQVMQTLTHHVCKRKTGLWYVFVQEEKRDTTQGLLCSQPRSCREVISV